VDDHLHCYFLKFFQGEYVVKLEVSEATSNDKGVYNLIAKNEKGEVVSNPIEVKEIVEEKADKPSIDEKLKSIVSVSTRENVVVFLWFFFQTFPVPF